MGRTPWATQHHEPTMPTSKLYGALDSSHHAFRAKSIVHPTSIQPDFFADFQKVHEPLPTWTTTQKQSYHPQPFSNDASQVAKEVATLNNLCHVRVFTPFITKDTSTSTTFQRDYISHQRDAIHDQNIQIIKAINSKSPLPSLPDLPSADTWKTHYKTTYSKKLVVTPISKCTPLQSTSIHFGNDPIVWTTVTKSHLPYPSIQSTDSNTSLKDAPSGAKFDLIKMESNEPLPTWTTTQKEDYQLAKAPSEPIDLSFQSDLNKSHTHLTCSSIDSLTPPTFHSNYQSHFVTPPSTALHRASPFRPSTPFSFDQSQEPWSSTTRSTYLPPPPSTSIPSSDASTSTATNITTTTTTTLPSCSFVSCSRTSSPYVKPLTKPNLSTIWTSVMKSDYTFLESASPSDSMSCSSTSPLLSSPSIEKKRIKANDVPDLLAMDPPLSTSTTSSSTSASFLPIKSYETQPCTLRKDSNRSHFQLSYTPSTSFLQSEYKEKQDMVLEKWKWHKPTSFQSKETFATSFKHVFGINAPESVPHSNALQKLKQ